MRRRVQASFCQSGVEPRNEQFLWQAIKFCSPHAPPSFAPRPQAEHGKQESQGSEYCSRVEEDCLSELLSEETGFSADTIREKRRIQMAEKRARIKANRRKSDKPKVLRIATSQAAPAPPSTITITERAEGLASLSPSRQSMNRVEDVPDRSAGSAQDCMREEENEPDEYEEMGTRTISEVAGDSPGSTSSDAQDWHLSPVTQDQEQHEEQISSSHLYIFLFFTLSTSDEKL
ncbi:hypothetical protein R3P38DRAFT_2810090 [Favolaschia claudopus]|uniref:Uncharacterized protein n=1 Tax=Favolaschia claudopus TaxID=2862362 RepID=A0AAV9ZBQ1_9AGAR